MTRTIFAVPLASSADSFSFSFSFSLSFSLSRSFGRSPQLAGFSDSQGQRQNLLLAGEVRRLDLDLDLDLSRWRERDREGSRGLLSAFSAPATVEDQAGYPLNGSCAISDRQCLYHHHSPPPHLPPPRSPESCQPKHKRQAPESIHGHAPADPVNSAVHVHTSCCVTSRKRRSAKLFGAPTIHANSFSFFLKSGFCASLYPESKIYLKPWALLTCRRHPSPFCLLLGFFGICSSGGKDQRNAMIMRYFWGEEPLTALPDVSRH